MTGINIERMSRNTEELLENNKLHLLRVPGAYIKDPVTTKKFMISDSYPSMTRYGIISNYAIFETKSTKPTDIHNSIFFDESFATLNIWQKRAVILTLANMNREFPGKTSVTHDPHLFDPVVMKVAQILLTR